MKTLGSSHLFNKLVKNDNIIKTIKLFSNEKNLKLLDKDMFNDSISVINRRMNYGTKSDILNMLDKNRIVLINDPDNKLPKFITTVGVITNGKIKNIINLNGYIINETVYPKTLFSLLQNALITTRLSESWNKFTMNIEFTKNLSMAYSRLTTKVLDKIFAIDLDTFKSDFLSYVFAKFFLIYICDKVPGETIDKLAYMSCFNRSSFDLIKDQEIQLGGDDLYKDIFTLFKELKQLKGFTSLNIRSFIEEYVKMYGESSLMSLDYLPSLLHMLFSSIVGGNICKDYIIESVSGKMNLKAYNIFVSLL